MASDEIDIRVTLEDALSAPAKLVQREIHQIGDEASVAAAKLAMLERQLNRTGKSSSMAANDQKRLNAELAKTEAALNKNVAATKKNENANQSAVAAVEKVARTVAKATAIHENHDRVLSRSAGPNGGMFKMLTFGASLGKIFMVGKFAAMGAGIVQLAAGVTALGGAAVTALAGLAPLGALVVAFPGYMAALGQGLMVGKLAFKGMGNAIKTVMDPKASPEALAASMKDLTPQAQKFVQAMKPFAGITDKWAKSVQKELLPSLTAVMKTATGFKGIVGSALKETAKEMAGAVKQANAFLKLSSTKSQTKGIMSGNAKIVGSFGSAAVNGLRIALPILAAANPMMQMLAANFAAFTNKVAGFAESNGAGLSTFFDHLGDLTMRTVHTINDLAIGLYNIFRLSTGSAASMGARFETMIKRFRDWTDSTKGQNAITKFFADIQPAVDATTRLFVSLVKAIGELGTNKGSMDQFTKTFNMLDEKAVPALQKILQSLGDSDFLVKLLEGVTNLVTFLSDIDFAGKFAILAQIFLSITQAVNALPGPLKEALAIVLSISSVFKAMTMSVGLLGKGGGLLGHVTGRTAGVNAITSASVTGAAGTSTGLAARAAAKANAARRRAGNWITNDGGLSGDNGDSFNNRLNGGRPFGPQLPTRMERANMGVRNYGSQMMGRVGTAATIAGIGMVASGIVGGGEEKGVRAELGSIGNMAAMGAGVGALFGPIGAAVGGVVGALAGLGTAALAASESLEQNGKNINAANIAIDKPGGSTSANYANLSTQNTSATDGIKDPGIGQYVANFIDEFGISFFGGGDSKYKTEFAKEKETYEASAKRELGYNSQLESLYNAQNNKVEGYSLAPNVDLSAQKSLFDRAAAAGIVNMPKGDETRGQVTSRLTAWDTAVKDRSVARDVGMTKNSPGALAVVNSKMSAMSGINKLDGNAWEASVKSMPGMIEAMTKAKLAINKTTKSFVDMAPIQRAQAKNTKLQENALNSLAKGGPKQVAAQLQGFAVAATKSGKSLKDMTDKSPALQAAMKKARLTVNAAGDALVALPKAPKIKMKIITQGFEKIDKVNNKIKKLEQRKAIILKANPADVDSKIAAIDTKIGRKKFKVGELTLKNEEALKTITDVVTGAEDAKPMMEIDGNAKLALDALAAVRLDAMNNPATITINEVKGTVVEGKRQAGGPVVQGLTYRVNEVGSEGFLDKLGRITKIPGGEHRQSFKEDGVVIPAHEMQAMEATKRMRKRDDTAYAGNAASSNRATVVAERSGDINIANVNMHQDGDLAREVIRAQRAQAREAKERAIKPIGRR